METHVKSARGVLLREDRDSVRMFDVRGGRLARSHSICLNFTSRLGTLADLHLPQERGELRFHALDQII